MVDARDLKSLSVSAECRFESGLRHKKTRIGDQGLVKKQGRLFFIDGLNFTNLLKYYFKNTIRLMSEKFCDFKR